MSGHSKWSQIKRQKGVTDAKRGQLFTRLTREIIIVTRQGGANPESNFRLRLAVQKARDNNMPLENVERAIKRGAGELDDVSFVELTLEGYGPNGVAIIVDAVTDNRNRTIQEVRNIFNRNGGNLGENGCVAWIFDIKGVITLETTGVDTEEIALHAIDAGADDVKFENNYMEVYTTPQVLETVRIALEAKSVTITSTDVSRVPKSTIDVDEKVALQALRLLDKLEELDEVQRVFSNVDFSEATLEKLRIIV